MVFFILALVGHRCCCKGFVAIRKISRWQIEGWGQPPQLDGAHTVPRCQLAPSGRRKEADASKKQRKLNNFFHTW